MAETMVRMGEYAVSSVAGEVLVSLGLGSCIGLVLLDRRAAVAGLAHVVLPAIADRDARTPGKFADTAVDALIADMAPLGARRARTEAVLVGGASMFGAAGENLHVGHRNEMAVRAELARVRIPVVAADTGGALGRTVRVPLDTGRVTSRQAGAPEQELHGGWRPGGGTMTAVDRLRTAGPGASRAEVAR